MVSGTAVSDQIRQGTRSGHSCIMQHFRGTRVQSAGPSVPY